MADPVTEFEDLSRFIVNENHYRKKDLSIKPQAFFPNKAGKTSVFRKSGLSNGAIWNIAHDVARQLGKTLFGRADIRVFDVLEQGLRVEPDEPPEKHANIIGWPHEESDKAKRMIIGLKLAAASRPIFLQSTS
jgi:hypothetical protein